MDKIAAVWRADAPVADVPVADAPGRTEEAR
jgi:hypothetical protein